MRDFSNPREQYIGGNDPMSNDTSFKTDDANKLLPTQSRGFQLEEPPSMKQPEKLKNIRPLTRPSLLSPSGERTNRRSRAERKSPTNEDSQVDRVVGKWNEPIRVKPDEIMDSVEVNPPIRR
jgi:hypothetical protein